MTTSTRTAARRGLAAAIAGALCAAASPSRAAEPYWDAVDALAVALYRNVSNATQGAPVARVAVLDFVGDGGAASQLGRCLADAVGAALGVASDGALSAVPRDAVERAFAKGRAKHEGWRTSADVPPAKLAKLKLGADAFVTGRTRTVDARVDVAVQAYAPDGKSLGVASGAIAADDESLRTARGGGRCPRRPSGSGA